MSDWAAALSQYHTNSANAGVTPSASANTKGSYSSVFTLAKPSFGFWYAPSWNQSHGTARTVFLDIASGGAGSENILVANLAFNPGGYGGSATTSRPRTQAHVFVPLLLPAGEIRARAQCNMASHGIGYHSLVASDTFIPQIGSFAVCDTYGATTGTTRGVSVSANASENVYGSWTEITASCNSVKAMLVSVLHGNTWQTTHNDQWHQFQIGIGSAGNEVVVFSSGECGLNSSDGGIPSPLFGPFYIDIPSGTRISVRMKKQYTTQRALDFILYGLR